MAVLFAVNFYQPFLLLIPIILLVCISLIKYPHFSFLLLIGSIPWSAELTFGFNLSTDIPDEPLMWLISLSSALYLLRLQKKEFSELFHPLVLIVLFQFLWTLISVLNSNNFVFSLKFLLAKGWYVLSFLIFPIILFKNIQWLKRAALLLMLSVFAATVVAVIRHASYQFEFASVNNALSPFFRNHVIYSSLLVFILPIQFAFLKLTDRIVARNLLIGILVITFIALFLSFSRGAWLAFIIGSFSWFLLKKKILAFAFATMVILTVVGFFLLINNDRFIKYSPDYKTTVFHENFGEHLTATYELKDLSTAERFYRWIAAIRMVREYWMTGSGPTTFYEEYKPYTIPLFRTWVSDNRERSTVHNYYLLVLVEQGIFGLLLLLLLLYSAFAYAEKLYHKVNDKFLKVVIASVSSILVMECVINFLSDLIETDKVGSIFYLCIAVLVIADRISKQIPLDPSSNI